MTPLDKAREALAAVEKATEGLIVAGDTFKNPGDDYWRSGIDVPDAKGTHYNRVEAYGRPESEAVDLRAAIVSAVNFVRADLPALVAEVERGAKLEALALQYRDDLRYPPTADSRERRLAAIAAALTPAKGAKYGR